MTNTIHLPSPVSDGSSYRTQGRLFVVVRDPATGELAWREKSEEPSPVVDHEGQPVLKLESRP